MLGFGPGSSSVTVLVKGLTGGHDLAVSKSTVALLLFRFSMW